MSPQNWSEHTIDYKDAADLLLKHAVETDRRNRMVFPTVFLYRHYIELILKEIIMNSREFLKMSRPFPKGHDLLRLWKICRELMEAADKVVDAGFAESDAYQDEIVSLYDALEADIGRFAEVDPDSEHFRYPVDIKAKPIEIDQNQLAKLLRELPELVSRIGNLLDGASVGIYTILDEKYRNLESGEAA